MIPVLEPRGDRPLQMTIEDQLKILVFYHLEERVSARHMLQVLEQEDFARENIGPIRRYIKKNEKVDNHTDKFHRSLLHEMPHDKVRIKIQFLRSVHIKR